MKQYLKPYAYKELERVAISVTAFLLKNEPTSVLYVAWLIPRGGGATVKASLNRASRLPLVVATVAYTRPETR